MIEQTKMIQNPNECLLQWLPHQWTYSNQINYQQLGLPIGLVMWGVCDLPEEALISVAQNHSRCWHWEHHHRLMLLQISETPGDTSLWSMGYICFIRTEWSNNCHDRIFAEDQSFKSHQAEAQAIGSWYYRSADTQTSPAKHQRRIPKKF